MGEPDFPAIAPLSRHHGHALALAALLALAGFASGCASKSFIISGHSSASNDEAVQEANNAIANAEQGGCRAISLGGGTGSGVGVGLGLGLGLGVGQCEECKVIDKKVQEMATESRVDYSVHVLLRCPTGVRTVQPDGVVVR